MRTCQLLPAALILLSCAQSGHGMGEEEIGPDKDRGHLTVEQPGWPAGMVEILRHDSRVYSIWVNGNENFYFQATPDGIGELVKLYSQTRLRDHIVIYSPYVAWDSPTKERFVKWPCRLTPDLDSAKLNEPTTVRAVAQGCSRGGPGTDLGG